MDPDEQIFQRNQTSAYVVMTSHTATSKLMVCGEQLVQALDLQAEIMQDHLQMLAYSNSQSQCF